MVLSGGALSNWVCFLVPETSWSQGGGGGGGGCTLIFSHIRRLGPFFGVQNSKFQYFLGFSEK